MLKQLDQIIESAQNNNHRQLLVLAGNEVWGQQLAEQMFSHIEASIPLWIGERETQHTSVRAKQVFGWLGRELDLIVFNAYSGFDVDAFGAVSGSLKAGGILILLTPELSRWPDYKDPEHSRLCVHPHKEIPASSYYLKRLASLVEGSTAVTRITESDPESFIMASYKAISETAVTDVEAPYRTHEQQQAVDALVRVAKGHRRRPLVLTADRGRGKSAALGIAAAQLLQNGLQRIFVTAPSMAAVEVMFRHADALLPSAETSAGRIEWQGGFVQFIAPDELAQSVSQIECDLMLVDEAAAIPVSILTALLKSCSRIAFASTIHGYEGTGRGFAVKFKKVLDQVAPKWRGMHINQPVRWSANDPLEAFVFQALLLNAEPDSVSQSKEVNRPDYEFEKLNRNELADNENLLKQVFGLLVLAHYKTRPFDLRHLLDGPNIEVFVMKLEGVVVATALLAKEGGIEDELQEAVWLGKRRVKGHLLPQSLSNHAGFPEAVGFEGYRVIRIAVHPDLQGQGIGQLFLDKLTVYAQQQQLDFMGSSFGASEELVRFWSLCGYQSVRAGLVREASSGGYSLMVIKPLSPAFEKLLPEILERFTENLLLQLPDHLQSMETALARNILCSCQIPPMTLSTRDKLDLESFVHSDRLYESCQLAIRKLLLISFLEQEAADDHRDLLVAKVLQNQSWQQLASSFGLTGRKQVVARLKSDTGQLLAALS
ncbi:tRNA(Met) cytidine acetyltransferase TmcA [Endozoicomonas sp. OPT23]|uniref:tRNA(Met) cytidine acetyltransferase TmcA n=1 Tax=Endozoicomonas sp. OPT23 TaxID=2072845 RepID=UPI00351B38A0